jgi:hypothetical protein
MEDGEIIFTPLLMFFTNSNNAKPFAGEEYPQRRKHLKSN